MIDILFDGAERIATVNNRSSVLARLEKFRVSYRVVDSASSNIVLCFARAESPLISAMSADIREKVVVVDEGSSFDGAAVDQYRQSMGLLGIVESDAYRQWKAGMLVMSGLFGREDVASRAGLVPCEDGGLIRSAEDEDVIDTLVRFLKAAAAR